MSSALTQERRNARSVAKRMFELLTPGCSIKGVSCSFVKKSKNLKRISIYYPLHEFTDFI
ncbi:MAG: hypothetical protein OXB86_06350 [Bdellovibrionales bacterium]|nr:hypothetical protein [Bdellovibrionales bacterium]